MKKVRAKIVENKRMAPDVYKMSVESTYLGGSSRPGQFVEVRCTSGTEPLLRRALCVHRITKRGISLLYQVVGRGTTILSHKKNGEELDILGPLGNRFSIRPGMAVLVAGGVGVATLTALAEELRRKRHKVIALLGDQTAEHIVCEKELKRIGCRVSISTEDGSKGRKGLVTDLLKHLLRTKDYGPTTAVYACGPDPMSRAVSKIAAEHGIPCQVSLGDRMACGVGVCLGCPVKIRTKVASHESRVTSHEYKMACKDGPVFDAAEVIW